MSKTLHKFPCYATGNKTPATDAKGNANKETGKTSSYSSQNYSTNIVMNVFYQKGNKVFGKSHDSFWLINNSKL